MTSSGNLDQNLLIPRNSYLDFSLERKEKPYILNIRILMTR